QLQHFRDALGALEGAMQQRDATTLRALIGHASRGRNQHAQQWPVGGVGAAGGVVAVAHAAPSAAAQASGSATHPAHTPEPRLCLE
ncbi:MAG: hypothetical protein Q7T22_02530, partial [Serpentinimonas sp.]|nr:hypothetical protein [Serpentinimonas sp.]